MMKLTLENISCIVLVVLIIALIVVRIINSVKKRNNVISSDDKSTKFIKSKKFGIIMYSLLGITVFGFIGGVIWASNSHSSMDYNELTMKNLERMKNMGKEAPQLSMPESFEKTILYMDGKAIQAYTNGRYYIFTVSFPGTGYSMNTWYICEKYIDSSMEYDPKLMSGSGVMEDLEARGKYVEGVSLQYVEPEVELEDIPEGFEKVIKDHNGVECVSYVKDNYSIDYMIFDEYEDWYLVKVSTGGIGIHSYIRYEPSFMTGR